MAEADLPPAMILDLKKPRHRETQTPKGSYRQTFIIIMYRDMSVARTDETSASGFATGGEAKALFINGLWLPDRRIPDRF